MHQHFEIKVPGGKLVVVDVATDEGRITDVRLSGDFFLEPDEAYDAFGPALTGAAVSETTEELQSRLDRALAGFEDLALHGFSTRDVAVAVKRAVSGGTDFTDHEWQIIRPGPLPTQVNVALDEVMLNQVAAGERGPTLRFWEWEDRATVIGSYQSYVNEVDPAGVEKHGIEVVRRISGGGAMFMEGGNCITYSLYVPESLVAGLSYEDSYAYLDQWVLGALARHGVNAWYEPINDITSDGGKIGGAAQKRRRGAVLHHATMSYDIDADKMMEVLRIGKVKLASKGLRSAKKRVDPLRRQTGASREEIIGTMAAEFTNRYGAEPASLSEEDLAAAHALVAEKFGTEAWTHHVP
ncbi:biotin/lipoate A/B protein ligase [Corynebacterium humireducens NBRC 106098 = DSM 45392]|uniref:Biotin/lipoate A/B protein ligase n=1 Tax=Corynebacterium humireducens NBRC 106098 = DSM 45392 TaxID=1223515 RepID=A0A0B5DAS9_9CORY|nr:biotin/lipoate A/B protein ligase family protein [Corynebacterium humireducens]AJE32809.1 biotin/lipoate A/B protein ligase [Corynebacterium humireducens NBRC 106098 = DSM 45392]